MMDGSWRAVETYTAPHVSTRPSRASVVAGVAGALAVLVTVVVGVASSVPLRRDARAVTRMLSSGHAHFVEPVSADHFQRGNVHTHSTRSDGTAPLGDMIGWYRDHGYQFLAMTEHDQRLDPAELDAYATPGFVVIPGEEVTDSWGDRPLHVNALCARATIPGGRHFDRAEVGLATILAEVRGQGGVPLVNHPNFHWALQATDIARGASGRILLEMWSGLPAVQATGDPTHPSEEAIWDEVLARGTDALPVAVDDAHGLHDGPGGSDALPGRGWVETFGNETSRDAICAALAGGRLYASNGPSFARIAVQGDTLLVATTDAAATVAFLGERGETLLEARAAEVPLSQGAHELSYHLAGGELLVRARLTDALGHQAWTAAYRVGP
jgi:hypothetical protein